MSILNLTSESSRKKRAFGNKKLAAVDKLPRLSPFLILFGSLIFLSSIGMPDAFAVSLFVSAENSEFSNYFTGPQIIEVVINDPDIAATDEAKGEPDVTVNGKDLRMVQGTDGLWYGYFADRNQAQQADSTVGSDGLGLDFGKFCSSTSASSISGGPSFTDTAGVAFPRNVVGGTDGTIALGTCTASGLTLQNHVVREPVTPTPPSGSILRGQIGIDENVWPFVQLYNFVPTGNVVIQYNRGGGVETITLTFDTNTFLTSNLTLDSSSYNPNSQVRLTIKDNQLDIDPTDEDSWTFDTTPGAEKIFYQLFDENGVSDADGTLGAVDITPFLTNLMFEDNGQLGVTASSGGSTFLQFVDNDDQVYPASTSLTQQMTLIETTDVSGNFVNYDESNNSNLLVSSSAPTGSTPITYNGFTSNVNIVGGAGGNIITVSNPTVTFDFFTVGSTTVYNMLISETLTNTLATSQPFAYVLEVRDQDGAIISTNWITGTLAGGASFTPSLGFIAPSVGTYTATVSIFDDLVTPLVIGPTTTFKIAVQVPHAVTPTITGTLGNNDWYTSDVGIAWNIQDSTLIFHPPITSQNGCDPASVTSDTASTSFTCSATSVDGTGSATATIKRDATSPALSISSPADNALLNTDTVSVNGISSDATSGLEKVEVAIDSGSFVTASGTTSWSLTTPTLTQGAHTIDVKSTDNAGNTQTTSESITIDTVAPNAPVITTASTTTNDNTQTIQGTTDAGTTVEVFDGMTSLGNAVVAGTSWSFDTAALSDGDHTITARATDAAGNTSGDSNSITLTIDTLPPVITLLGANPVTVAQGSTYTDAGATAFDTRDGVLTSSIVTVNPVNTSVTGSYPVTYNVSDSAGNTAVQVTRTVKVVSVQLDSDQYFINHAGLITVNDPAANTDGTTQQTVSATITSTSDPTGFPITLTETTNTSGIFQNTNYIVFTSGTTDQANSRLHVVVGDTVTANYNPTDTALIISDDALPPVVGDPANLSERETCTDWSGDGDGDGICTDWENLGAPAGLSAQLLVDTNGDLVDDTIIQYDLTCDAANPNDDPNCPSAGTKDIYLEIDWMEGHRPSDAALNLVKTAFSNRGITLHIQLSDEIGHQNTISWSDATGASEFDQIKDNYFGTASERTTGTAQEIRDRLTAKRQLFHYVLFAHDRTGFIGSSGVAETPGNDILVTLGSFEGATGTVDQQAGTLMHELGHNLNLLHGGPFPDVANLADEPNRRDNCKPNYLSVMSYSRQFEEFVAGRELTYSRMQLANLDESNLNENDGVQLYLNPAELTAYGPGPVLTSLTGVAIDWDRDVPPDSDDTGVQANINDFDIIGCNTDEYAGVAAQKLLKGYEDWTALKYYFRDTNTFDDGMHTADDAIPEITIDTVTEFRLAFLDALYQAIQDLPDSAFVGDPALARSELLNDVTTADNLIVQQDVNGAIAILQDMRAKLDGSVGGSTSDDLIVLSAQGPILETLDNIIAGYTIASEPAGNHNEEIITNTFDEIRALVNSGVLNNGQANSLTSKLNNALEKLNQKDNPSGCNQLKAFVNEVNAMVKNKKLSTLQAETLIDAINDIRDEACS